MSMKVMVFFLVLTVAFLIIGCFSCLLGLYLFCKGEWLTGTFSIIVGIVKAYMMGAVILDLIDTNREELIKYLQNER